MEMQSARHSLKEISMFASFRASATSLAIGIGLMLFISDVAAQPYSGELQTATGEIWPSIEPYILAPRKALELPEPNQPGDLEIAAGDIWPSRQNTPASQGPPLLSCSIRSIDRRPAKFAVARASAGALQSSLSSQRFSQHISK